MWDWDYIVPNCGNPQKAQRYPFEWIQALRKMASFHADMLLPGHGPPICKIPKSKWSSMFRYFDASLKLTIVIS
jgi:hypothetical protein